VNKRVFFLIAVLMGMSVEGMQQDKPADSAKNFDWFADISDDDEKNHFNPETKVWYGVFADSPWNIVRRLPRPKSPFPFHAATKNTEDL
jgi:hypothetical protein